MVGAATASVIALGQFEAAAVVPDAVEGSTVHSCHGLCCVHKTVAELVKQTKPEAIKGQDIPLGGPGSS